MGRSTAERLMIKPNSTVWLSHVEHLLQLTPMPDGVRQVATMATASVAIIFFEDAAAAREILTAHKGDLNLPAVLWVAYPKAAESGLENAGLGPILGEFGLGPDGRIAIDNTWSAIRCGAPNER